jgi:RNA polymerase sigma-70 factor (ECF subfamily)
MDHADYVDTNAQAPELAVNLRDLERGLAQLSPDQRQVLLLVCLEDMSYEQVARVTGVPIGTVMSRLHRARERLRRWLAGEQKAPLRRIK